MVVLLLGSQKVAPSIPSIFIIKDSQLAGDVEDVKLRVSTDLHGLMI